MYKKIVEYHYTGHEKQYLEDSIKFRCRFCGELKSASDFTEDAHAVAECVGNKKIFTRYECDCCNLKFAKAEEYQLGMLLRLCAGIPAGDVLLIPRG